MRASCDPAFCHFIDAGGDCEDCWYERTKARIAREKATCLTEELVRLRRACEGGIVMKSLDERMRAVDGGLWCPYTDSDLVEDSCIAEFCVHYNPDTHECVHVEAAMAQVRAAEALTGLYSLLKQKEAGHECY